MADLKQRMRAWRTLVKTPEQREDAETEAGRIAENFLKELVDSNLKYKNGYAFLGKRIPSARHGCRFEVDLIVLTRKHIHVLEVKNWSGTLERDGRYWIQTRRNGQEIEHPSLIDLNEDKKEALVSYLRDAGVTIDPSYITQKIIFMNKNLRILSPEIEENPYIIQAWELDRYLNSQRGTSQAERFVHSVIEMLLDKEGGSMVLDVFFKSMHGKDFKQSLSLLESLETWDQLRLHGGKTLVGDALQLITPAGKIDLKKLPNDSKHPLKWRRSPLFSFLFCVLGKADLGSIRLAGDRIMLTPDDKIKFHIVMEPRPCEISLAEVELLVRG